MSGLYLGMKRGRRRSRTFFCRKCQEFLRDNLTPVIAPKKREKRDREMLKYTFLFVAVTSEEDNASGMLEGILRGQKGFFPSQCVQEVRLRNPNSVKQGAIATAPRNSSQASKPASTAVNQVGNGVGGNLDNANLSGNQRHFATAQRPKDFM